MILEIMLGAIFVGGGGVLVWLGKVHVDDVRRAKEEEAELERLRLEQERLEDERQREEQRVIAERRLEQERLAVEHRREFERQRLEKERLAEELRREQQRQRLEQERLMEEHRREIEKLEQQRLAAEHRREEERLAADRRREYERLAEERRREEERLAEERQRELERIEQETLAAKRLRKEERLALEGRFDQLRLAARRRREEDQFTEERRGAEELLAVEDRKAEISRIGGLIYKEFSDRGVPSFNTQSFAAQQRLAPGDVIEAGLLLYRGMVRDAVSNKEYTSQRKLQLDWIARALEIDMAEVAEIETLARTPVYRAAFQAALSNITFTAESLAELETVRQSISLRQEDASEIMIRDGGRDVYFLMIESTIDTVQADSARRELLRSLRRLLFNGWETSFASPDQVDPLYRKAVALVLQDRIVEDQEREFLEWLRDEIRPSQPEFDECASWIEAVAKLADFRSGRLPIVPTTYFLEGGELCHFVGVCCYFEESKRGQVGLCGELLVTDRKVRFISDEKSISMRPSQIMDVATEGRRIHLKTDSSRGRITVEVSDPSELEAILIGVARRNKYAVNYASASSRHIPQHIKTAVWSRDGGRCVKCGIDHALQFDHIIPFSEGAASTVDNLQILCSPCNLQKGDRI